MTTELRLTSLKIRNYRALRDVQLPEHGENWGQRIPDVVVIAGPNGSGKTTLLRVIVESIREPMESLRRMPNGSTSEVVITMGDDLPILEVGRLSIGSFMRSKTAIHRLDPETGQVVSRKDKFWATWRQDPKSLPSLLFIPSDSRSLNVAGPKNKRPGTWPKRHAIHEWTAPRSWEQSVEALLYTARWRDLNAKEDGHPEDATVFAAYHDAFRAFFPTKKLVWTKGELAVETVQGDHHGIDELSAGEKQILMLLGELYTYWHPGSLVMIDEPELHLHPALQIRFFESLLKLRKERGGQLIIATQSAEIYAAAPSGSHLHLGRAR